MFKTKGADWYFIIPATLVWISALLVTAWDFVRIPQGAYRFGIINLVGLSSALFGVSLRLWARKTLGRYFSARLRILNEHQLVKCGICH
jgi:isoprenylcysteine carboxyl methyltransferase (ICMT) family protein YpbQ